MPTNLAHRWGMVLPGGDGIRLRPLTRFICGDERPKQFCPLLSDSCLLQQARQRAERSIYPDQILYSVVKAHRDYYIHDLADRIPQTVVQPGNRGTGPAIVAPLLRILQMDPNAIIAVLPSDHYYSAESVFSYSFERAFAIAEGGRVLACCWEHSRGRQKSNMGGLNSENPSPVTARTSFV
jgi:mannose-1-phosphate guanylyltransferase